MDLKACLAAGYSRTSGAYDHVAGPLYLTGLQRLLPKIRLAPGPAILDVGCGTGLNLLEAARVLGPCRLLAGIDIAPGMVARAQAKAAAAGLPAAFAVGDAEALPYADATFDLVICNSVYHWFRDRGQAIREMARVLRPGGQLLLICAAKPGFAEWFTLIDRLVRAAKGPAAPPAFPDLPVPWELYGHIVAAGLEPDHFRHTVQPLLVRNPNAFVELMDTVAPHWHAFLADDERSAVQNLACRALASTLPMGFRCTWAALETVARKSMVRLP